MVRLILSRCDSAEIIKITEEIKMKYVCDVCGYAYDEAAEGTAWEALTDDYACPLCGVGKEQFSKE